MAGPSSSGSERRSQFARRLATDTQVAKRREEVINAVRTAAKADVQAGERSERLTTDDFAVYINARADSTSTGSE
ncbi:MAG: hypothetical protein SGJ20_17375 [Planctomycetota bacterium]|nr:hypothetical protein [Planctomycetota bacterium]